MTIQTHTIRPHKGKRRQKDLQVALSKKRLTPAPQDTSSAAESTHLACKKWRDNVSIFAIAAAASEPNSWASDSDLERVFNGR